MKIKIACWGILIVLICIVAVPAQTPDWYLKAKKIEILKSTREDVIRVFGEPRESSKKYDASYKYDDYIIYVHYSHGLCEVTKKEGWNVPEFTVTSIFVSLYKNINYRKLNLKLKKLYREEIYDVPNAYVYYDYENGESYGIDSKGLLESVSFDPGQKSDYLYCKK